MLVFRFLFLSLVLSVSAHADEKPFAAWLIYPHIANSPALEVWKSSSSSIWRLTKIDGTRIAEIVEPPLATGYTFNYGDCKINNEVRYDMIAMVKHSDFKVWSEQVLSIWIADPVTKNFTRTSSEGVSCRNERYGI